jgi:hypothetical protein
MYSELADGGHTFRVRASDRAGNVDPEPATFTWTVAPPVPPETTPPETEPEEPVLPEEEELPPDDTGGDQAPSFTPPGQDKGGKE